MIRCICAKMKEEIVFVISIALALITGFFAPTHVEAIDLKVIFSLFNLMLIAVAFEKYHLLEYISISILKRAKSERSIGFTMIIITSLLGMLITNDVALITVVPITIHMSKKAGFDPFRIVALETVAANIGSSLTPFGNPQNLFLYSFYKMPTITFFITVIPVVVMGMLFLLFYNQSNSKEKKNLDLPDVVLSNKKRLFVYGIVFLIVLLSVLRIIDYFLVTGIVILVFVAKDIHLFKRVDYFLLGTFVCFFIFIDHIMHFTLLQNNIGSLLSNEFSTFFVSVILSQVISNVPAAILLSSFTSFSKALLLGVSVGGMGTLIASLANLISYKFYVKAYPASHYKKYFYRLNLLGLLVCCVLVIAMIYIETK